KSTTGGCQFLGQRLISWQCKKQTIVATSTTEAEYVAAANCCGQVLWVQNQLLDYGFNFMNTKIHIDNESTICIVKNPVYHSKTKHIEIRHHFIRDCYEKKLISVEKIHTDLNVADLHSMDGKMKGRSDKTATANTKADGSLEINATIDTIRYTITEASIRDTLQLEDATGITMLPNDEIFEGMGQMGYPTDGTFTFWKSFFTPQWRYLVHHLLHCISSKSGGWDQFGSNIATALICLSTDRVYNFSKLIFDGMVANLKSKTKFLMYPRFLQMILNIQTENKHLYLAVSLTKKIFGNMKRGFRGAPRPLLPAMLLVASTNPNAGQEHDAVTQTQPSSSTPPVPSTSSPPVQSPPPIPTTIPTPTPTPPPIPETEPEPFEHTLEEPSPVHQHLSPPQEQAQGQMTMDDLLQVVPQLISRIDSLETDLKQTKLTMGNAIVKLVKKVKKLEGLLKRRDVVLSDSEEEEPEAQGRKSQDDPLDSLVQGLVTPTTTKVNVSGEEQVEDISPNTLEAAKTLSRVASLKPKSIDKGRRYKRRKETKGKKVVSSLDFQEEVDTGAEEVNTAEGVNTGSIKLSTVSEQVSTVSEQVSTGSAKKSTPSPDKGQRAGKAPMIIEETPKKSKEQILQEEASLAEAIRLDTLQKEEVAKQVHLDSLLAQRIAEEEELNEQQKKRKAQVQFEAQHYTDEDWDLIRAKIEANAELSKSMLGSELQGEDFAKKMVDLVNQRKKYFAEERARAKRNKPMTQSQLKTYMMNYLKNQGTWKLSQLKNLSFEEVKKEFDKLVKQVESFAPINFEATKASLKRFGEELQTKTPKRLKDDEDVEAKDDEPTKKSGKRRKQMARKGLHTSVDKDDSEGSDEDSEQDDSVTGTKTPINPVPVAMKTPSIATYKIFKQGEKGAYQIVREDGTDIVYINFGAMLKAISRDDLTELYRIVMNRYGMDGPEDELEKVFWKYLKNMFEEPLSTDPIWSELGQQRIINVPKAMLDKKLQGGKPDENCYKCLKRWKASGIRKVDMVINPPWNLPFLGAKGLTSPEQTATGKGISNPFMAVMLTKPQAFHPCYASLLRIRNGGPGTTSGMAGIGDSRLPLISKQFDISKISQEMAEQDIPAPTITAMKIPIIRKGEYDIWSMRMRQYICHTDHNLWDVIVNGDLEEEPAPTTGETSAPPAPKTAKQLRGNQIEVWCQLEVHGAPISKEDINQKFLRSLPSSWNQIALIMRNKPNIDEIDIDDLYNNLRVYEDELKRSSGSNSTSQNMAFLSSKNTGGTNKVSIVSGDFRVSTAGGINQVPSTPCAHDDLDLRWQVAMLTVRVKKKGHFTRECRSGRNQGRRSYGDNGRSNAPTNESSSQALVAQDGLGGYDWSNDFEVEPVNYALMAISSSSSSSSSDSEVQKCSKQCLESFKTLQKNYDTEREKHNKAKLEIRGYEIALESLESRILGHEKNELAWGEKYEFQNYELKCREIKINNLNLELEKVVKERDELKDKIAKWEESTKNLDEILNSQMSARDKTGKDWKDKKKQKRSKTDKKREKDKESRARARISQRSQPDQPDTVKEIKELKDPR
ncbi:hypothetical protein Tco_0336430, partial [Tanacetum coccineum]